ncbi:unnamed protein product [Eruca vesicaria subsp. sativa]|uniref:Uncharacterized protein n=1 Tax=Eruca vesicaria subsp. sativa TaxID=29727 RepID=A0ABC8M385_ERUVS|nr:unnamed protein product [Eruca vesicaria subsp. sativa]
MKSVSILALLVLFLVVSETPKIKANNNACFEEYNPTGDETPDFLLCRVPVYPSLCYKKCQETREGAKGGKCKFDINPADSKCFCNYCSDDSIPLYLTKSIVM